MKNNPKIGQFCWNELATSNVDAAKEFYGKVFGWEFSDYDSGDMVYTIIKCNGEDFGGIWSIPKEKEKEIPPHWMAYILVNDLNASLEKSTQNGASIIRPASPAGDKGYFAIIKDPAGAYIALWQSRDA
jgi:predicted enzyme related to lactoylglutathione lyase